MQIVNAKLYRQQSRELSKVVMLEVVQRQTFHRKPRFHIF